MCVYVRSFKLFGFKKCRVPVAGRRGGGGGAYFQKNLEGFSCWVSSGCLSRESSEDVEIAAKQVRDCSYIAMIYIYIYTYIHRCMHICVCCMSVFYEYF